MINRFGMTLVILFAFAVAAHAVESVEKHMYNANGSMNHVIYEDVNQPVDHFFHRAFKALSLHDANLDTAMMGKPTHLASTSHNSPSSTLLASPLPMDHSVSPLRGRYQPVLNFAMHRPAQYHGWYDRSHSSRSAAAAQDHDISRRAALVGAGALWMTTGLVGPTQAKPVQMTSNPVEELKDKLEGVIKQKIKSGELDMSLADITRLILHDAITYDPATKTGGFSGSIRFAEELNRPENVRLAPVVKKLEALQKELQQATGEAITFSDTVAVTGEFIADRDFKKARCEALKDGEAFALFNRVNLKVDGFDPWCKTINEAFGNRPKRLPFGRQDSTGPDPEGRVPWVGSSMEDFKEAFKRTRLTAFEFSTLAMGILEDETKGIEFLKSDKEFDGILKFWAASEFPKTPSRNGYEVTFYDAYTKLVNTGRFSPKPYGIENSADLTRFNLKARAL